MSSHTAQPSTVELFDRSVATLARSWMYLADGSPGAEVIETDGALIAAFVHSPDREHLNNALLTRGVKELSGASTGSRESLLTAGSSATTFSTR